MLWQLPSCIFEERAGLADCPGQVGTRDAQLLTVDKQLSYLASRTFLVGCRETLKNLVCLGSYYQTVEAWCTKQQRCCERMSAMQLALAEGLAGKRSVGLWSSELLDITPNPAAPCRGTTSLSRSTPGHSAT